MRIERDFPNTDADAEQARNALLQKGWNETVALVPPGTATSSKRNDATRSPEAERKAKERLHMREQGWNQHNVMAPNNALAREFLSAAAQRIKSPKVLKALRAALDDPDLVRIGKKVRRLRGEKGDQVRKMLGL